MKKRNSQGFTLVELLVASGVTAIIVALMVTMVSNLLSAYNRSSGRLSAQSQSGLVLEQLSAELQSMVMRNNGDVMFQVSQVGQLDGAGKTQPTGIVAPPGELTDPWEELPIENYGFGPGGLWLKFFTTAPSLTDDSESGVRAMGYRIDYNPVAPNSSVSNYMLYRTEIPSQVTFDWGYDLTDAFYTDSTSYTYTYTNRDGDEETVTLPNGLKNDPVLEDLPQQIIADNVIDFGVRLFTQEGNQNREIEFPKSDNQQYAASGDGTLDPYPRSVEVMVRILTPEGRRLIEAIDEGNLDLDWWETAVQNSIVFSRVINIPSRPI